MSIWKTPNEKQNDEKVSKSIFDDLNDTPAHVSKPNPINRTDSAQFYDITLPHTVAVFGYDADQEHKIEMMLRDAGNVVDVRKDQHSMLLTYSTHIGAENAIRLHKTVIGSTRIAVELQKVENKIVLEPLQRNSFFNLYYISAVILLLLALSSWYSLT